MKYFVRHLYHLNFDGHTDFLMKYYSLLWHSGGQHTQKGQGEQNLRNFTMLLFSYNTVITQDSLLNELILFWERVIRNNKGYR